MSKRAGCAALLLSAVGTAHASCGVATLVDPDSAVEVNDNCNAGTWWLHCAQGYVEVKGSERSQSCGWFRFRRDFITCKKLCDAGRVSGLPEVQRYRHSERGVYDLHPIRSDAVRAADDSGVLLGKAGGGGNGAPPFMEGLWWMGGNPAPEYVVSLANGAWDPSVTAAHPEPTSTIEVWKTQRWSFAPDTAGRALYDLLELQGGTKATFKFRVSKDVKADSSTDPHDLKYADLETVVSLCSGTDSLFRKLGLCLGQGLSRDIVHWYMEKQDDDEWHRKSRTLNLDVAATNLCSALDWVPGWGEVCRAVFGPEPLIHTYYLKRIADRDGKPTRHWAEYVAAVKEYSLVAHRAGADAALFPAARREGSDEKQTPHSGSGWPVFAAGTAAGMLLCGMCVGVVARTRRARDTDEAGLSAPLSVADPAVADEDKTIDV